MKCQTVKLDLASGKGTAGDYRSCTDLVYIENEILKMDWSHLRIRRYIRFIRSEIGLVSHLGQLVAPKLEAILIT
jgi:hypothetical protein